MSNTLKFHLASSVSNLLIIILLANINLWIIDLIDPMIFVKRGGSFDFLWVAYFFGFFWIFTLSIYIIKNPKKHLYVFILFGLILILIYVGYGFFKTGISIGYERASLLLYLKNAFSETIIFIIAVAFGIHFSQLIIGKKFHKEHYQ